jgi:hypothetical protein
VLEWAAAVGQQHQQQQQQQQGPQQQQLQQAGMKDKDLDYLIVQYLKKKG